MGSKEFRVTDKAITTHSKLKDKYRQDEEIAFHTTIFNNASKDLNLTTLHFFLTEKREKGQTPAPERNITKNTSYTLAINKSQTVTLSISLSDVSPATYNVTSYFEDKLGVKFYVVKDREITVRSALQIPAIVWALIGISIAILLMFIGYYLSGKIG